MAQAMVQAMDGPWPGHGPIAEAMDGPGQCSTFFIFLFVIFLFVIIQKYENEEQIQKDKRINEKGQNNEKCRTLARTVHGLGYGAMTRPRPVHGLDHGLGHGPSMASAMAYGPWP